jgi:hypothetical protein
MATADSLSSSAIYNPWQIGSEEVFTSPLADSQEEELLIFSEVLGDGSIEAEVSILEGKPLLTGEPKEGAIAFRFKDSRNYYFAGLGAWGAKYCIGRVEMGQSQPIVVSGKSSFLEMNKPYNLRVEFSGSQMSLYENDVPQISGVDDTFKSGQWGFRTWNTSAKFVRAQSQARQPMCFLIMPFADESRMVYRVLKEVVEKHGFRCERADTSYLTTPIIDEIKEAITRADLIIVDLTGKNANVYYEAGYALALNKRIIHIAQSAADLPFDVKHLRTFVYSFEFGGDRQLMTDLSQAIQATTGYSIRS